MSNVDEPEVPDQPEWTLTDSLAMAADQFDALLTMVAGYRTKAVEAGFSEYAAEEMAVQVHAKLLED